MKKISICGLDCADCPCFLALQNDNDELRKKTAKEWTKRYIKEDLNRPALKPEDISCLGCLSLTEPLYKHCKVCGVRECGLKMKIQNCGQCAEYDDCKKIASLHKRIPEGKRACEEIKKKRK